MSQVEAIGKYVVAELRQVRQQATHGMLLSEETELVVVSIGNEVGAVKVGDIILTTNYSEDNYTFEGKRYVIIEEKHVKARVK